MQVVATDVDTGRLDALVAEVPDIRAEVMDVTKPESVSSVISGVGNRSCADPHNDLEITMHYGQSSTAHLCDS